MPFSMLRARHPRAVRAVLELVLVLGLWTAYSLSRLFGGTAMGPALHRAHELLDVEDYLGINIEPLLNGLFSTHHLLGLVGSYWYATLHYVVTGICLLWLYRLGERSYLPARRALVVATLLGLAAYLVLPTAPPRFMQGYVDVLSLHAGDGWWSADASAPRGLGGLTNELAAFPSLHAGWALWVAICLQRHARWRPLRGAGWLYAAGTSVVIVGTGNHWVIDVVVGWLVVLAGFAAADHLDRAGELIGLRTPVRGPAPGGEPALLASRHAGD
jgi:PAP2 superfamily protein